MRKTTRRGFSLMEVMISIGIVSVGLFGAIAIIPFGHEQVTRGLLEDRKAMAGKNWVAEFHTRGMGRAENWMLPNNTQVYNFSSTQYPALFPPREAFLIDPRLVAVKGPSTPKFPAASAAAASTIQIQRISLRAFSNGTGSRMNPPQADQIFRSQDDLVFQAGADEFQPPVQEYALLNGDPNKPLKRQSNGRMSWMAMVAPKVGANNNTAVSDLFTLSVIVFEDRDLQQEEHLAQVADPTHFYSSGIGGGDMKITASGGHADDIEVRKGEWVMLAGRKGTNKVMKWYRVIGTSLPSNNGTAWQRDITLQGPDWDFSVPSMQTPYVVIVPNVVAVFEKTIRLETSSLWSN